jgi:hypothetical protein
VVVAGLGYLRGLGGNTFRCVTVPPPKLPERDPPLKKGVNPVSIEQESKCISDDVLGTLFERIYIRDT